MAFAEKIKFLRKEQGWSQDKLAHQIGIHGRHVSKYEAGQALPNSETLIRIASVLNVSIDYLLLDDKEIDKPSAKLKDKDLLKAFEDLDQMNDNDKYIVKSLIEAFIKKRKVEKLMKEDKIPA